MTLKELTKSEMHETVSDCFWSGHELRVGTTDKEKVDLEKRQNNREVGLGTHKYSEKKNILILSKSTKKFFGKIFFL